MNTYIVTVKLDKNPDHDPKNKVKGECPLTYGYCTDASGAHHSILAKNFISTEAVRVYYEKVLGFHVTRIESV
jgi:hypothetical protein